MSAKWDCKVEDSCPSWVSYPCLNSSEGLDLDPMLYREVKNVNGKRMCYRLDGNETVSYWLGHSPDYPENTLIKQTGRWTIKGGVELFDRNVSSLIWIPISVAQVNFSACTSQVEIVNKYVVHSKTSVSSSK